MTPERQYLRWFFAAAAASLALIALLNLAVDPYSVFGSPRIPRFNANKPDFVEQLRLTHVYAVARRKPGCILLGTSRTGRGLDPDHPALRQLDCYNMALPSVSLYEMRRYFQHAQTARRVILALDFRVFTTPTDTTGAFSEARLEADAEGRPQFNLFSAKLPDLAGALLSLTALQSSVKTVRQQDWTTDTLGSDGYWLKLTDRYDHRRAFAALTRDSIAHFAELRNDDAMFANSSQELRALLRTAYASGAEVSLLISPSHAWHWQTLEMSGLWPRFEGIKRNLVQVNAEESSRAGRSAFAIWDFSGAYGPSAEAVPKSSGAKMRWYWESVHYKRELGELMVDRILRNVRSTEWPDFGVELSMESIEAHLAALRSAQRAYAAEHPEVITTIRALIHEGNDLEALTKVAR